MGHVRGGKLFKLFGSNSLHHGDPRPSICVISPELDNIRYFLNFKHEKNVLFFL